MRKALVSIAIGALVAVPGAAHAAEAESADRVEVGTPSCYVWVDYPEVWFYSLYPPVIGHDLDHAGAGYQCPIRP